MASMKRSPLIVVSVVVLIAAIAAGALWRAGNRSPVTAATPDASASDFGGPFSLIDQNGVRRSDSDFRGKYMLVFFGYTYCPDVCPTMLATEAEALDKLGARASAIVPIFITVDPKRDTPEKLKPYLESFDPKPPSARRAFVGLTGSDEEIAKAAKAYRVYYRAHLDGQVEIGDYSVDHSSEVYLMNPEGKFVAYYSAGILPDEMAADLQQNTRSPTD
jgi:cytochrome oxidase Cu insertion factor (SCO1/SenC/PrrC family)